MAEENSGSAATQVGRGPGGGMTEEEANKRYDGLITVRNKAIKGKGAWYWAHLEPMLVRNSDTGLPKTVKLRCTLCDAVFSASNPSRTASEHLKRGTCPNFSSLVKPIASLPPPQQNHRKRNSSGRNRAAGNASASANYQVPPPLPIVDQSRFLPELSYPLPLSTPVPAVSSSSAAHGGPGMFTQHHPPTHMVLSGGKEDLGALAMLEDSVKKLKSPKSSPAGPTLSKTQIDSAFDLLADWVYECCGTVSFSSLDHPKFRAFLNHVGLPPISRRELAGSRLDAKYNEAKAESDAKIRDAMFFQLAADGWTGKKKQGGHFGEQNLVTLSVNLPNGTSVFRKTVLTSGYVPSKYAEDVLWDTVTEICPNSVHQCVGIVADKFKSKALRNLESQHQWMVNISCQSRAFNKLIKDFAKELPFFKNASDNCARLANFMNSKSQVRNALLKYQVQEYGHAEPLRAPRESSDFEMAVSLVEDVLNSTKAIHLAATDESFKSSLPSEVGDLVRNPRFWIELNVVYSLVDVVKTMSREIEAEKPRVGQCLPLWEELRVKVKEWRSRYHVAEGPVEKIIDRRFQKNYHPAWAAAFILDPLYLVRDSSGKYLPPFKLLTPDQEKDVDRLITRLVSREEAHIALMELMKWRTEGLEPVYAQAVQLKQRDAATGKMRLANPQSSRLVWETYLAGFKSLGKVAVRLIFLHATSSGFKCNWPLTRWVGGAQSHSRAGTDRAQKLMFVAAHSKMEKRGEWANDEERDAELFSLANGEDDVLNEVYVDTSSL
ncbi:hypothetical protein DM860_001796 [Cuscuta australis]|uniref:DUF7963 domain-containing protein n=1 Tax=Cuscuta australis TaxID=267555 RepID=A0A328EDB2_9ASTE|nr:hypothetical protein DM860_001796 [Cuscuta australis]